MKIDPKHLLKVVKYSDVRNSLPYYEFSADENLVNLANILNKSGIKNIKAEYNKDAFRVDIIDTTNDGIKRLYAIASNYAYMRCEEEYNGKKEVRDCKIGFNELKIDEKSKTVSIIRDSAPMGEVNVDLLSDLKVTLEKCGFTLEVSGLVEDVKEGYVL